MNNDSYTGVQKAAILLITLGPEKAATIFKHLKEDEIEELTLEIANTRSVSPQTKEEVLEEFYQLCLAQQYIAEGGIGYATELLEKALGNDKAQGVIAKLTASLQVRPFEFIRKTDPAQLLNFIQDEHPQTIAMILSYLAPAQASQVLGALPPEKQADVAKRIATMDRTSPDVIKEVERVLERKLASLVNQDYTIVGGIDAIVGILNSVDRKELRSMLQIAIPSILQQSTVSIGMMIVQAVVNPFGTQALAGYAATMRVENVFSLIFVSIGNAVSPYVSQNLGAKKIWRIKKGYHAALVLDICFVVLAFIVIETLHTHISSLFLGKDGTALAYQVSGDYMKWLGYFFIFMGIKMATDGVLRGLGIMRPFLIANMVNLAIRLSVALICAPRFGIEFVWLAVPAGWFANFLISYVALRKSWPVEKVD